MGIPSLEIVKFLIVIIDDFIPALSRKNLFTRTDGPQSTCLIGTTLLMIVVRVGWLDVIAFYGLIVTVEQAVNEPHNSAADYQYCQ